MNTAAWQSLRALRATPTGLAVAKPDRRKTFAAALRQAEELAEAAQVAGYAAKPLPLFYSLSQAGRAIAAARLTGRWALSGHGLRATVDPQKALLETLVAPMGKGGDSFTGVATAVGSPVLNGSARLGALWAANPDLLHVRIPPSAGTWPRALPIPSSGDESLPETQTVRTVGMIHASVDLPGDTGREIDDALRTYPTLRKAFATKSGGNERAGPDDRVIRLPMDSGSTQTLVAVDAPAETTAADLGRRRRALASFVEPGGRGRTHPATFIGYALPAMADGLSPHPLLLWWALLLGLSSLARYEPATWTAAIDVDSSPLAVSLEQVLDVASERVPVRILQSLKAET